MKKIGMIGGMSWESSSIYYKLINQYVNKKLGGVNSAEILLSSVNFQEIEECQLNNEWEKSGFILSNEAKKLESAGADVIILCTNTMHKVSKQIIDSITIPFIHIADTTIQALKNKNISKVALLGTKYTMTQDFYINRIIESNIEVLIPPKKDLTIVNDIIFKELVKGNIKKESKDTYISIINDLFKKGATGVILGCTEIGMLIKQEDLSLPVFDTTIIHAEKTAEFALEN